LHYATVTGALRSGERVKVEDAGTCFDSAEGLGFNRLTIASPYAPR
jgi:hypothetical protein